MNFESKDGIAAQSSLRSNSTRYICICCLLWEQRRRTQTRVNFDCNRRQSVFVFSPLRHNKSVSLTISFVSTNSNLICNWMPFRSIIFPQCTYLWPICDSIINKSHVLLITHSLLELSAGWNNFCRYVIIALMVGWIAITTDSDHRFCLRIPHSMSISSHYSTNG